MLRNGKEMLFFGKVLLSTEMLALKTAHFTGQKKKKNGERRKGKKKKKPRGPYKAAFTPAPYSRKSRLTNLIIITQFTSFVTKF